MYDLSKLESLLQYLITQLASTSQFQGLPQTAPAFLMNNTHQINQAQMNGIVGIQEVMSSRENFKYPAYIFKDYKNIKHIKIAFFINEEIFKQTNQNCLQFFQDNKRKLTS